MQNEHRQRLYYGWIVVAVTALVLIVTAGVRSAPGAFLLEMQRDTGWSKAVLSFATALGLVLFGLGGPISGGLMNRFGVKRVTLASLVITAAAMILSSRIGAIWQLNLVFGLLSGLGTGLVASVLGATVATRWFIQKRGLVTGIFGASTSAGQLVFFPLLTALAVSIGWRESAVILAVIALVILAPVIALMRDDPSDLKLRPYGSNEGVPTTPPKPDPNIMARAVRSVDFWLLAVTFFVCGATSNGLIGQHFIPHAVDHGFDQRVAAGYLALMGAFNFVGTIASGWLTDRYDPRRLLMVYYGFRGLSLLFLPYVHDQLGIIAFAVMFGLDYIATVPPTVALTADTFGRRNVGVVYGWVFASHQLGAAAAAWVTGIARDTLGSYGLAFLVAGSIAVAAALLSLGIKRSSAAVAAATD